MAHTTCGSAVTRLALSGCTVPEIATNAGHSLKDVGAVLDAHYVGWTPKLAVSAAAKLKGAAAATEPMANKNWKTFKPFQMRPRISN